MGAPARTWRSYLTRVAARWLSRSGLGKRPMTVLSALWIGRPGIYTRPPTQSLLSIFRPEGKETDAGAEPVALLWIQG
jgi:hypothetical protein